MKHVIALLFVTVFTLVAPTIVSAQPVPPPGYHYEKHCYTVYAPFPYSKCEYILVRDYNIVPYPLYRPRVYYPVPQHRYRPVPPPPRHRHPAPPPGHGHHHGHR